MAIQLQPIFSASNSHPIQRLPFRHPPSSPDTNTRLQQRHSDIVPEELNLLVVGQPSDRFQGDHIDHAGSDESSTEGRYV